MLSDQELQSLRNLGNEAEAAADEIFRLRAIVSNGRAAYSAYGLLATPPTHDLHELGDVSKMRRALERIARWHGEFPATGKFWDDERTRPTSYAAEYGSNGERDYMRRVAMDALRPNDQTKLATTAGKDCDERHQN